MLAARQVFFEYNDTPLLNDVSFIAKAGQALHIKGSNGAGKSTLLKLLASLLTPVQGEILWNEKPIQDDLIAYRALMRYIGHDEGVHPLLTPQEIWELEVSQSTTILSLIEMTDLLGLNDVLKTPFSLLSAGQKRRVALMRLMSCEKIKIWLLDEPCASLDSEGCQLLASLMTKFLTGGGSVIVTSHLALPIAASMVSEYLL